MEHKKVNFLHSVRLKMLLAMAFFAFVTGGFACALFISSTKEEIGSVTRGYMRDLSRAYGVMLDNELDTDGDDALSGATKRKRPRIGTIVRYACVRWKSPLEIGK